jgi:hypothetical protein
VVKVPLPSCPWSLLSPQHHADPLDFKAHECDVEPNGKARVEKIARLGV